MVQKLIFLALAGALGTLARYGLAGLVQRSFGSGFPFGTLVVNLIGCFLAGTVLAIATSRINISSQVRVIIFIGFMGAFTTFSALILETGQLFRDAQWFWAVGNLVLSNVLGIVLFFCGLTIGRYI